MAQNFNSLESDIEFWQQESRSEKIGAGLSAACAAAFGCGAIALVWHGGVEGILGLGMGGGAAAFVKLGFEELRESRQLAHRAELIAGQQGSDSCKIIPLRTP